MEILFVIILVVVAGGIPLYFAVRSMSDAVPAARLKQSGKGLAAQAFILKARSTGTLDGNVPEMEFDLEIRPTERAPWQVRVRRNVPYESLSLCAVGALVNVLYDPENPKVVAFADF